MKALNARERRVLALGLLVLAIALVWLLLIRPVLDGFADRRDEVDELTQTYVRNEHVIGAMRASRIALRDQHATAADFALAAPSPGLASELLRERMVDIARRQHAQVSGAEEAETRPGVVAVRADLIVAQDRVPALIADVERAPPWLVIEHLTIGADRSAQSGRAAPVDVRLDVSVRYEASRAAR